MFETAFCPHCGAKRPEWAKFCGTCGNAYDGPPKSSSAPAQAPTPAPIIAPPSTPTATVVAPPAAAQAQPTSAAMVAGVAWIIGGGLTGYLASLQASLADNPYLAGSNVGAVAGWNAIAAILSIAFGAALLVRPSRGLLTASAVWGAITVLWNGYNILNGATHWTYIGATIAALVAGIVAAVAREQWADPIAAGAVQCSHCNKWVPPNPSGLCHNCGYPIASA